MVEIIQLLEKIDFTTILSLGILIWFLSNQTKKSLGLRIDTLNIDLGLKIDRLDSDIRIMNKEFSLMNTRVSRLEGTVYGKDTYNQIDKPKE